MGRATAWVVATVVLGWGTPWIAQANREVEIRRLPGSSQTARGISQITFHTDRGKLNRANARRIAGKIRELPELFGPEREFPPLVVIDAQGPGIITVQGEPAIGRIQIPVGAKPEKIEVFPGYNQEALKEPGDITEEITIGWRAGETNQKTGTWSIPWSGPREWFRSSKRWGDLLPLMETQEKTIPWEKIQHETQKSDQGWQYIQSKGEINESLKANCLDLGMALTGENPQGRSLIIGNGHCLVRMENGSIVETGVLTGPGAWEKKLEQAATRGEKESRQMMARDRNTEEITPIFWEEIYHKK
jgi:hypothetical protein